MDNAEALRVANLYYDQVRHDFKFDKSEAAGRLAAFGLFSMQEIARIIDWSFNSVQQAAGWYVDLGPNNTGRKWNISSLSALYLTALDYRRGHVNKILIQRLAKAGDSVRAIAELTGVPIDDVRRAVYGDPNLLDLLRARPDA